MARLPLFSLSVATVAAGASHRPFCPPYEFGATCFDMRCGKDFVLLWGRHFQPKNATSCRNLSGVMMPNTAAGRLGKFSLRTTGGLAPNF